VFTLAKLALWYIGECYVYKETGTIKLNDLRMPDKNQKIVYKINHINYN